MSTELRRPGGVAATCIKALAIAGMSWKRRLAYLGETAVRSVFLGFMLFIFAQLWRAVQSRVELRPGGLELGQLVWYMAFAEAVVFSSPSNWSLDLDREVKTGDIAYRLGRPISYPLYHLAMSLGDRLHRFLVCLGIGAAVCLVVVGPIDFHLGAIGAALCTALLGLLIDELCTLSISLTSFWVENTNGLHLLYRRAVLLLGGAFVPLEAYPEWLSRLCLALPLRHLASGPARLFVGSSAAGAAQLLLVQLAWGGAALLPLLLIHHLGLRRVSAQGG